MTHNEQSFNDSEDANLEGDKKYEQLRKLYNLRLETVQESIKRSIEAIQTDKLMDTLKEEEYVAQYGYERIKEILNQCINNDRETLIEKLSQDYAELKSDYLKLDQANSKVLMITLHF